MAKSLTQAFKSLIAPLAALTAGFASFEGIKSAVDKTKEMGAEVAKLSRETGMSAESTSKMLFAFEHVGLGADDASKSLGFFSKNLMKVSEDAEDGDKKTKPISETLKSLGINALDAAGNIRPMDALIGEVADKFKAMADGPEKTALAMELFGKSGKDLIPILNQGSEGLAELSKQAEKMGLVLSEKNVADIKKYTVAQREMGEAMGAIKLQIGLALMPVLTSLADMMVTLEMKARPLIGKLIDLANLAIAPVVSWVVAFFGNLKTLNQALFDSSGYADGLSGSWLTLYSRLQPLVDKLSPFVDKVKEFGGRADVAQASAVGLGSAFSVAMLPGAMNAAGALGGVIQGLAILPNPAIIAAGVIGLLAGGFYYAYKQSTAFRDAVDTLGQKAASIASTLERGILSKVRELVHLFALGFEGGKIGGSFSEIEKAAFGLGKAAQTAVGFIRDMVGTVSDLFGLFKTGLSGGSIGGEFSTIEQAAFRVGEVLRPLVDFIGAHQDTFITLGLAIAAVATAFVAFGGAALVLSPVLAAIGAVFAVLTSPITAVIVAVGLLGFGLYELVTHWDDVKAAVGSAVDTINAKVPELGLVFDIAKTSILIAFEALKAGFQVVMDAFSPVVDFFRENWALITDLFSQAFGLLVTIAVDELELIRVAIDTGLRVIRDVVHIILDLIHGDFGAVWGDIKQLVSDVFNGLVEGAKAFSRLFYDAFMGLISMIPDAIEFALNAVIGAVETAINAVIKAYNKVADLPLNPMPHFDPIKLDRVHLATGTPSFAGGLALLGEQGPELAVLPSGTRVLPNRQTEQALGGGGLHIHFDGPVYGFAEFESVVAGIMQRYQSRSLQLAARGI